MIDAAGKCLHHALEFEFEQHSGEGTHRQVGADGKHVDLLVVVSAERIHDEGLGFVQLGEELALDALLSGGTEGGIILPAHGRHSDEVMEVA